MQAVKVSGRKVRYAVVGAGWISQAAFMPGVAHTGNSELTALVTGDQQKAKQLSTLYKIPKTYDYDSYDRLLESGEVDAVYLALPNEMHTEWALRTLRAGLHLLLEKPMATSEADCEAICQAARESGAKLMLAYRLHFEPLTLEAIRVARSGEIGDPRFFNASFSQHVASSNHRANHGFWSGPVPDMGPYPLNAARHLFGAEPVEVSAVGAQNTKLGFDFDDTVSVTLRFPGERLAQFTVSYGADAADAYRLVGDKGDLLASPGFGFAKPMELTVTVDGKSRARTFAPTDQFGGELQYFSDCILQDRQPEPDGEEGLADVRVLAAIHESLRTGRRQQLETFSRSLRPEMSMKKELPPVDPPEQINSSAPQQG
ncbi:MAG: Gfo/Idh/MocA family protein [Janthinobacterium lividum]